MMAADAGVGDGLFRPGPRCEEPDRRACEDLPDMVVILLKALRLPTNPIEKT
jgi:hypothetical protein